MYPLAHDALGNPIDVPPNAASWRVRRQTGRQGRPAYIPGPDGSPLVVPLDATIDDLRALGCPPGMCRLDAIDEKGKPLGGPIAFVEIAGDDDSDRAANENNDPLRTAVQALARVVECTEKAEGMVRVMESMQRAQVERDKTMGQIVLALIDRGSGSRSNDLRDALVAHNEIEEAIDDSHARRLAKLADLLPAAPANDSPPQQAGWTDGLKTMVPGVLPILGVVVAKKILKLTDEEIADYIKTWAALSGGADGPLSQAIKTAGLSTDTVPTAPTAEPAPDQATPSPEPQPTATASSPAAAVSGAPEAPDSAAQTSDAPQPQATNATIAASRANGHSSEEAAAKLAAVIDRLTLEERAEVARLVPLMTPAAQEQVQAHLLGLSVEEAVALLRMYLKRR